jgi:hypothetical protein
MIQPRHSSRHRERAANSDTVGSGMHIVKTPNAAIAALLVLAACSDPPGSGAGNTRVVTVDIPVTPNRDLDALFIIDDSTALDVQTSIKLNFPNFINVLSSLPGGLPNLHLGVVTSDLGTKGAEDAAPGPPIGSGPGSCAGDGDSGNLTTNGTSLVSGTFINDIRNADGTRTKNYTSTLDEAFAAIASVGASGCGFEQTIEAAKRAVNNNPANAGFVRPNALLAMIFVQDEDDCSFAHSTLLGPESETLGPLQSFRCNRFGHVCADGGEDADAMNTPGIKSGCTSNESSPYLTRVGDYATFFKGLKADPDDVIVAAISGPTTPYEVELRSPPGGGTPIPAIAHACSYTGSTETVTVADPAVRMKSFLDLFPDRNTFSTVCQEDLSGALTQVALLIRRVIGSPCFDAQLADVDPTTPGPQYDCTVSDVIHRGTPNQTEQVLPECNNRESPMSSTNKPCWSILPDALDCPATPSLALQVERTEAPHPDTHVIAACVGEP